MAAAGVAVPRVETASMAALCAQAGRPFIIAHDLESRLDLRLEDGLPATLRRSPLAAGATWYALISPDGIVGQYDRERWGVEVDDAPEEPPPEPAAAPPPRLRWLPLAGQDVDVAAACTPPRHVTTRDMTLDEALDTWLGGPAACTGPHDCFPERHVYLRGMLPSPTATAALAGSVFDALVATSLFGSRLPAASLYASRRGLQTNLHVDEHSGFLVQLHGHKRVVLFPKGPGSRPLRCQGWGDAAAPVSRRAWFDGGVPDEPGWAERPPFAGLAGCEVEVGPGEALYIPKGWFHDVLSRADETFGLVLRCLGG